MIERLYDSLRDGFLPPVLLAAVSSFLAVIEENRFLATGTFLVSFLWVCVAISRETRNWLDRK